jgi:hypothetical protein
LLLEINSFLYSHDDLHQLAFALSSYDTAPPPVFKGLPSLLGVPINISLGGQPGLLENLQRIDSIFVEEVAKIGRHGSIKCFT